MQILFASAIFRTTFIADETGTITRIMGPKEIKVTSVPLKRDDY